MKGQPQRARARLRRTEKGVAPRPSGDFGLVSAALRRARGLRTASNKLARWVRLVAAFVIAIVASSSTLAWALPCCAHDEHADAAKSDTESDGDGCCSGKSRPAGADDADDSDEEGSCSCPIPCSPCCSGAAGVALLPIPECEARILPGGTILDLDYPDRSPPDAEARDVIHVPRRAA